MEEADLLKNDNISQSFFLFLLSLRNLERVKMSEFLVWVYRFQDFAQTLQSFAQLHNCMTA